MQAFDLAGRAIAEALETGQIGTPVAVRVVAAITADHGKIERQLARLLETSAGWFQSPPDQLTAFGSVEVGQISALARFESGATALVAAGANGAGRPLLEIVVWGNRGVLSWDAAEYVLAPPTGEPDPTLSEQASRFLQWARDSIASGQTVHIEEGAGTIRGGDQIDRVQHHARAVPTGQTVDQVTPPFGVLLVSGDFTHQPNYAEVFRDDPRCTLIGLTDEAELPPRRQALNEQFAQRMGIPLLPNLDEALNREDVHVVCICAEPERRGPLIVQAARAGKHLFLDKPLAGSLQEADAIVSAIQEAGVISQMWSLVHSGHAGRVGAAVRNALVGDLTAIHQDLSFAKGQAGQAELGRPRQEDPSPRHYERADSKRELTNVGVYPLVMLLWLTGRRVRRVSATTGNYFLWEHQQNGMEDFGQMLLELEGGLVATISAGRTGWRSHRGNGLNRVCLIGNRNLALFDADRPRVEVWADVEPWTAPRRDPEDPMGMWATPRPEAFAARPKQDWIVPASLRSNDDIERFLDCLEKGQASDVPAEMGAEATEVLLAAYRSAASGEVVTLPLPRGDG